MIERSWLEFCQTECYLGTATAAVAAAKLGQEASECEDAIAIDAQNCPVRCCRWRHRSIRRAQLGRTTGPTLGATQIHTDVEEFREWVAAEGRELHDSWNGLTLSWYSEEKARNGSFAAFVGVELDLKSESPSWKAIALGDTCLLHCRGGALLKSLPLSRSESFNQRRCWWLRIAASTRKQHAVSSDRFRQLSKMATYCC